MALNAYLAQVQSLLDDFGGVEYTTANLTIYINDARVQVAGASESIRGLASLALTNGTPNYAYASATGFATGVGGLLSVRKMRVQVSGVFVEVMNREWDWFWSYCLCGPAASTPGAPNTFSELNPGIAGQLYVSPTPNQGYTASLDAVCYPIPLVNDSTVEALPYPWTEAVQYYAAYLALLNAQRNADADAMFQRYEVFERRGTQMTTPTALPVNRPGGPGAKIASTKSVLTTPQQAGGGG